MSMDNSCLRVLDDLPVAAGFSLRNGGVSKAPYASLNLGLSTGDERERVLENRRRMFEWLGFPLDRLAIAGQVHGDRVMDVADPGLFPGYDAMVTRTPGVLLCISTADCAAVLLADVGAGVIGACHAGWRGAAAGIAGKTVVRMEAIGAEAVRIRAVIGPCLCTEHFEVGEEVAAQFDGPFVHRLSGQVRPHVDLKAAVRAQLRESGLPPDSIETSPYCTHCEPDRFFSYRAEGGTTGRMMGFIGLIPDRRPDDGLLGIDTGSPAG
jgi:polyphenol oxidase